MDMLVAFFRDEPMTTKSVEVAGARAVNLLTVIQWLDTGDRTDDIYLSLSTLIMAQAYANSILHFRPTLLFSTISRHLMEKFASNVQQHAKIKSLLNALYMTLMGSANVQQHYETFLNVMRELTILHSISTPPPSLPSVSSLSQPTSRVHRWLQCLMEKMCSRVPLHAEVHGTVALAILYLSQSATLSTTVTHSTTTVTHPTTTTSTLLHPNTLNDAALSNLIDPLQKMELAMLKYLIVPVQKMPMNSLYAHQCKIIQSQLSQRLLAPS